MSAAAPIPEEFHELQVVSGAEYATQSDSSRFRTSDEEEEFTTVIDGCWASNTPVGVAFSTEDLVLFLRRRISSIPEVETVRVAKRRTRGHETWHVWTILTRDDRETRFKVYEIEQDLVNHFPEILFEFHSHKTREHAPSGDTTVYESRS